MLLGISAPLLNLTLGTRLWSAALLKDVVRASTDLPRSAGHCVMKSGDRLFGFTLSLLPSVFHRLSSVFCQQFSARRVNQRKSVSAFFQKNFHYLLDI